MTNLTLGAFLLSIMGHSFTKVVLTEELIRLCRQVSSIDISPVSIKTQTLMIV